MLVGLIVCALAACSAQATPIRSQAVTATGLTITLDTGVVFTVTITHVSGNTYSVVVKNGSVTSASTTLTSATPTSTTTWIQTNASSAIGSGSVGATCPNSQNPPLNLAISVTSLSPLALVFEASECADVIPANWTTLISQ